MRWGLPSHVRHAGQGPGVWWRPFPCKYGPSSHLSVPAQSRVPRAKWKGDREQVPATYSLREILCLVRLTCTSVEFCCFWFMYFVRATYGGIVLKEWKKINKPYPFRLYHFWGLFDSWEAGCLALSRKKALPGSSFPSQASQTAPISACNKCSAYENLRTAKSKRKLVAIYRLFCSLSHLSQNMTRENITVASFSSSFWFSSCRYMIIASKRKRTDQSKMTRTWASTIQVSTIKEEFYRSADLYPPPFSPLPSLGSQSGLRIGDTSHAVDLLLCKTKHSRELLNLEHKVQPQDSDSYTTWYPFLLSTCSCMPYQGSDCIAWRYPLICCWLHPFAPGVHL